MSDFQLNVIEESKRRPVLADFWAPWCDPCLLLNPILTELEQENDGQWKLVKVNIDEEKEVAESYHIKGVPAVRIFFNGEIIAAYNGLMWKKDFARWIHDQLFEQNV
jgi:thioredoxin